MTCGSVTFDYDEWTQAFPELASISSIRAQMAFNVAALRISADDDSEIPDACQRKTVLYYLTAHVAVLMSQAATSSVDPDTGTATISPGMTGRVASATEGSVSVSTEGFTSANASSLETWLNSTQYGALVWQMIAPLFGPFYVAAPSRAGRFFP